LEAKLRLLPCLAILLLTASAIAQTAAPTATTTEAVTTKPAAAASDEQQWGFSLSAYTYIVPNDREYVQPTLRVDHDWLHLEARYNYEGIDTGSAWIGYNVSFGEDPLTFDFTPMVGGIFGNTRGVAPGYEFTLAWHKLQLYSEGEFVFDTDDSDANFFYTWTELTYSPVEWFRFGAVIQRTKDYETDFDIQRGVMIGFTLKQLDLMAAVLNPDDDPIVVLGVAYSF
jgi:hypothetical protein